MACMKKEKLILLNARVLSDPILLLCALAEEIGHHFTNVKSKYKYFPRTLVGFNQYIHKMNLKPEFGQLIF